MSDQNALNIYYHVVCAYEALSTVLGTLGSIFVFIVAIRLRKTTTFVFISFLAVTDAVSLYCWNMNEFIYVYFNFWIVEQSLYGCKIMTYAALVSLESSAWLLVMLSMDRLLSVLIKSWKTTYFKPKQALIASAVLIVFLLVLHFHVLFTFGYREYDVNGTYTDYCDSDKTPSIDFMNQWYLLHSIMYGFLPYAFLATTNAALIIFLKIHQRRLHDPTSTGQAKVSHKSRINTTVIILTLIFVLMTLPGSIIGLFYTVWVEQDWGSAVIYTFDAITSSYHALSFPILMLSNSRFRQEFYQVIRPVRTFISAKTDAQIDARVASSYRSAPSVCASRNSKLVPRSNKKHEIRHTQKSQNFGASRVIKLVKVH